MLRNTTFLNKILRIKPRTIIHVGAEYGQDRPAYEKVGAKAIYWCEADPDIIEILKTKYPQDEVVSGIFWDESEKEVDFYRTINRAQNSAIKPLDDSNIFVVETVKLTTKTLDEVFNEISLNKPIMLVVDVQGAEEKVLNGAKNLLTLCNYVVIEIALSSQGYSHTPHEQNIDERMKNINMKKSIFRIAKDMSYKDQLYMKTNTFATLIIAQLDTLFNIVMCIRHKIRTGHKIQLHYHCNYCEF